MNQQRFQDNMIEAANKLAEAAKLIAEARELLPTKWDEMKDGDEWITTPPQGHTALNVRGALVPSTDNELNKMATALKHHFGAR